MATTVLVTFDIEGERVTEDVYTELNRMGYFRVGERFGKKMLLPRTTVHGDFDSPKKPGAIAKEIFETLRDKANVKLSRICVAHVTDWFFAGPPDNDLFLQELFRSMGIDD